MSQRRFGAKLLREPQAASLFEVGQPPKSNPLATGRVMVIGESEGGLGVNQNAIYWFEDYDQAKEVLRSGVSLRLIDYIFHPSPNQDGAQAVGFVRAQNCTKASLILEDGSGNDVLKLESLDAGAYCNQIKVKVESGTSSGKKVTIQQGSEDPEIGDNLERPSIAVICADPAATATCTMDIDPITDAGDPGTLTTTVGGTGGSAANLNIAFSTYDTVQKVVDYINSQAYYEAIVLTGTPSDPSIWLDKVSSKDIHGPTTLSAGATAGDTTITVISATDAVVGDYGYLEDSGDPSKNETFKISEINGTVITLDSDYSPDGLIYDYTNGSNVFFKGNPNNADLYAIYKWVNDTSVLVSAARETDTAGEGEQPPTNVAWTYLSGGTDGSMTTTLYDSALSAIRPENVQIVMPATESAAYHAASMADCLDEGTRMAVCGGTVGETVAQAKARAFSLNSQYAVLCYPGVYKFKLDGSGTELLSPMYTAALVAGVIAGSVVQEPPTMNKISCEGLESDLTKSEREDLINGGVLSIKRVEGLGYVIVQGVNTVQNNLNLWNVDDDTTPEISLFRIRTQMQREWDQAAYRQFVGQSSTGIRIQDAETFAKGTLDRWVEEGLIAADPTDPISKPAWQDLKVYKDGDAIMASYGYRSADPINFFLTTQRVI